MRLNIQITKLILSFANSLFANLMLAKASAKLPAIRYSLIMMLWPAM